VTQGQKAAQEGLLPVVVKPANSVHENPSTSTKTKAKIEVDHDPHPLLLPTDPLQNRHQGEERHRQIVRLGEHLRQKVLTVRHLVDSLSQGIARMTNVDSCTSVAKGEVDHPPDAQLRLQRLRRETRVPDQDPNLLLRQTFVTCTPKARALTETGASSNMKSQLLPPSPKPKPKLRDHQLHYVLEYPEETHQP
jgi:hypothetical protein